MTGPEHEGGQDQSREQARDRSREQNPPLDPSGRPLPPQVTMGLLAYVSAHPLDEDYAHRAARRRAAGEAGAEERGRSSRASRGLLSLVALAAFGLIVGTAAVQTARSEPAQQASRDSLVEQVRDLRTEISSARATAAGLRDEIDAARSRALQASDRGRDLDARLTRLETASGVTALTGPGLRIEVDDAPDDGSGDAPVVLDTDLQKLVNGLWDSGAEAVAINGQRLTALSAIRVAGDAITVNFRSLSRPYVVVALGDPDELASRFVESEGGTWWLNLKSIYGLIFVTTAEEDLTVPAAPEPTLRHARPADPADAGDTADTGGRG